MPYTPNAVPTDPAALSDFLTRELQSLSSNDTQQRPHLFLQTLNVAPTKPREGMVAKADGTNWNPGSGAGLYTYRAGAWVPADQFLQAGTGAVSRTQHSRLRDQVCILDFMTSAQIADYQGRTFALDHATAFNLARAAVIASGGARELYMPAGILNLQSKITHVGSLSLVGVGHSGQDTTADNTANQGTLIRFGHTDVGFDVTGSAFSMRHVGWYRPQTAPGGGWTPYASDWDFQLATTDTHIEDVLAWGSKKGITLTAGGRLDINNLRGQFFLNGISVVSATDVVRLTNIHMWPMWSQNANVKTYMLANLIALELRRADGPFVHNFFSIWHNKGLRFKHDTSGDTTNCKGSNLYFDACAYGIITESDTNGVTAQLSNVNHQSDAAGTNGCGVQLNGTNAVIDIGGFTSTASDVSALRNADGTGNRLRIEHLYMTQWNGSNGGFGGCELSGTGNETTIGMNAVIGTAAAGATAAFTGSNIRQGIWKRVVVSGTTGGAGLISFAHGLGYAPGSAFVQLGGSNGYTCNVISLDATNVNCVVYSNGATLNSTAVAGIAITFY